VAQVVLAALIDAVLPPITLAMLGRLSPTLHKRLATERVNDFDTAGFGI
jgi:hypothetical protein